jgi:Domain of unknown function (DUF2935)
MSVNTQSVLFEHRFWLQILGDHARFIFNSLSPKEVSDIQIAQKFMYTFDQLLSIAHSSDAEGRLVELNQQAYYATMELRTFKLDLLRRSLLNQITIGLPPTFFNHMVNELEEYGRILNALIAGQPVPKYNPLHHDILWLSDAAFHAGAIASNLDRVEKSLLNKSIEYERHFEALYLKAVEMTGFMRIQLKDFPAFRHFHKEINFEMTLFKRFLEELEELGLKAEVLDRISPLMPDHMAREECYYLIKLAESGVVPQPDCDPTKPRVEQ